MNSHEQIKMMGWFSKIKTGGQIHFALRALFRLLNISTLAACVISSCKKWILFFPSMILLLRRRKLASNWAQQISAAILPLRCRSDLQKTECQFAFLLSENYLMKLLWLRLQKNTRMLQNFIYNIQKCLSKKQGKFFSIPASVFHSIILNACLPAGRQVAIHSSVVQLFNCGSNF